MLAQIDKRWLVIGGVLLILLVVGTALALSLPAEQAVTTPEPDRDAQLAYLSPTDGPADIYFYDPEIGQSQRLTETGGASSFSADLENLYLYFSAANEAGGAGIWQLDLARGAAQLLLDCGAASCEGLSLAPDGRWLAYERRDASVSAGIEVWLMDLVSNATRQLSPSREESSTPQWTGVIQPSLLLSYYNRSASAYILVNTHGEELERFDSDTGRPVAWEPGGLNFVAAEQFPVSTDILRGLEGEAVFQTPEPGSLEPVVLLASQLFSFSSEGSSPLFEDGEQLIEDAAAAFSPDGVWLAFTRKYLDEERWTPGRQLWLLDVESGELRQLGEDANYQVTALAWSPDSRQIAFVRSNQTDFGQPAELWLMDVATGESQLIALDAYAPGWIP